MKRIVLVLLFLVSVAGCYNPNTPAGHEGYLTRGAIVGSTKFYGAQTGPTSTGLGWLLSVQNVDVQWATFDEEFKVMSSDNLEVNFHAHALLRPRPGAVKEIVETYGGPAWYNRTVKEPFRNAVYEAVSGYKALEAKDKREEVARAAATKLSAYLKDKPFEMGSVVIGTINLPQSVAKSQEDKISTETRLATKDFEIEITKKDATKRIEEAKGIAESQSIINKTLSAQYLQHEAIQAQLQMANGQNHTTVYIPVGTNGLPLVKMVE